MSTFKTFQREVNFLKNIYFFIIFISLILVVFFKIISEDIVKHKEIDIELKKRRATLENVEDDYSSLMQDLTSKEKEYNRVLKMASTPFDSVDLVKLLEKYFTQYDIAENTNEVLKDTYKYKDLAINAKTTTPNNFYSFMKTIVFLNNIIEVVYPIEFESKNGYLHINFRLRTYILY